MTTSIHTASFWRRSRRGFTLIEVMISVALALILIYGVAQVFKMSTDVVGAQSAIQNIVRDHRAAVTTMTEDFRNCVFDSPLFLIDSQVAYDGTPEKEGPTQILRGFRAGFKTPFDESQAPASATPPVYAKDPMNYEINGKPFQANLTDYSDRTPRLDRLGFFARGFYRRQTAANAQAGGFSPTTSSEAYIWYGHTALPGITSGFTYANNIQMTLPQNQYAQDRILGRVAMLLRDPITFPATENYLAYAPPPAPQLSPLDYDTPAAIQSFTDLAGVTIDQWRQQANGVFVQQGPLKWYWPMDDGDPTITTPGNQKIWRINCQPTLQRPINAAKLAQTTPCFIPHCTQFIVEYAGDYLAQDANNVATPGKVIDVGQRIDPVTGFVSGKTDGEIDYVIEGDPALGTAVKRIRWYGMPRDTNGDGVIDYRDVLPLADVMNFYGFNGIAPWEKVLPTPAFASLGNNYATYKPSPGNPPKNFKYVCAWHNDAPMMIRISMKFDDPTGKLQDGQWYEYVLTR